MSVIDAGSFRTTKGSLRRFVCEEEEEEDFDK